MDETLEVECTSDNPDAQLALRSEDGTMYENATARFVVTMGSGFDAANQTFMCAITNAQGSCGGFIFRSSVIVYGKFHQYHKLLSSTVVSWVSAHGCLA